MNDFSSVRFFRLSPGGIECDEGGLRVGDVALLARDEKGAWAARDERDLDYDLSRAYGFPVNVRVKMAGLGAVANALQSRNIAKAQIAALLLRLPDPPAPRAPRLAHWKNDASRPRPCRLRTAESGRRLGRQAPENGCAAESRLVRAKTRRAAGGRAANANAGPAAGAPSRSSAPGGELAFVPPALTTGADSLLAENLSAAALDGLTTLAARVAVPTILFGAIFIPSANPIVDEGPVPGRPDMAYRWALDETQVTFKVLINGQWRTLTEGVARTGRRLLQS